MSYPVVAECWSILESALLLQARKLVEEIASHQKADPKALWAKVKPTIKIPLLDVDIPEQPLCTVSVERENSVVYERCRAPCLLGFDKCTAHLSSVPTHSEEYPMVDRIMDHEGIVYFVDAQSIARDSSGAVKGMVEDGVLYVFNKK